MAHIPVLVKEVLQYLDPKPNENMIDATVGEAGHAILMLDRTKPAGKLLGIDSDSDQIKNSRLILSGFKDRTVLVNDSYKNIKEIVTKEHFKNINGILADIGFSSWHMENSKRGFSFNQDEPLDMRYSLENNLTAQKIVNEYSENEITKILQEYGEESFAAKITKKIVAQRAVKKIETTFELKEIIESVVPQRFQHGRIHCATKTFQALRIAVNDELENLRIFLPAALGILEASGRLVVISFHSLEDRMVKNFFRDKAKEGVVTILTPKPVVAGLQEVLANKRSRSAKLRAIIKL